MSTLIAKKKRPLVKKIKKAFTRFRPRVRSRHPSHDPLRTQLPLLPFRSVTRLGSQTQEEDQHRLVECNTIQAVRNSANKLLMKQCFQQAAVKTAEWFKLADYLGTGIDTETKKENVEYGVGGSAVYMDFPLVTKSLNGSRGRGNTLHLNAESFRAWTEGRNTSNYIVEKFHDYVREYRLHVTKEGCFYTCRKMLKSDTPEKDRWFRNDSNSTWIVEENPQFDKPVNWDVIVSECVKALNAVGLDIGACDVKVQSAKDKKGNARKNPEFIVIEINSAPSFGDITLQKYVEQIPRVLQAKHSAQ